MNKNINKNNYNYEKSPAKKVNENLRLIYGLVRKNNTLIDKFKADDFYNADFQTLSYIFHVEGKMMDERLNKGYHKAYTQRNNLSFLFKNKPVKWECTGDKYFWDDLREHFKTIYSNKDASDFLRISKEIVKFYKKKTGEPLKEKAIGWCKEYVRSKYDDGKLSCDWWGSEGIPMILDEWHDWAIKKGYIDEEDEL